MLIIEMDMPKSCPCDLANGDTPCFAAYGIPKRWADFEKHSKLLHTRPWWCPIVGVLPDEHGDLIDRNALWELMRTYDDYQGAKGAHDLELIHRDSILFAIETAPTVIAAEREDNGTTTN